MARSNGHIAAAAILGAMCYALLAELAAFVNVASSRKLLRSRVSLAATQADVDAAKKEFELKKWAAGRLASEGSAQAAAAAARAQQAEASYMALKAQLDGQGPPAPVAAAPVAAASVAAAPVAAAAALAGAVSKADLAAAKQSAQLLTWSANKLASEGAPQAAAMKAKADQAVAAFEAMKQAAASGAAMPAAPAAPVAAPVVAAMPAAPVAAAPVAVSASSVSKEDLAAAKKSAQLLTWAATKLASEGAPQAAVMKAKADQAVAAFEALKQAEASGAPVAAAPAAPVAAAPAAPAPVAAAPAVSSSAASSAEDVLKAKKEMELHEWAAKQLEASGSLQAAVMKAKAEQSRQTYEALKEQQLVMR